MMMISKWKKNFGLTGFYKNNSALFECSGLLSQMKGQNDIIVMYAICYAMIFIW